jgi:hypothetical protein
MLQSRRAMKNILLNPQVSFDIIVVPPAPACDPMTGNLWTRLIACVHAGETDPRYTFEGREYLLVPVNCTTQQPLTWGEVFSK